MRRTDRAAWLLWALDLTLVALAAALLVLNRFSEAESAIGFPGYVALLGIAFASFGLLLGLRRPENPIGWVFLASGFLACGQEVATNYVVLALREPSWGLPGVAYAAWILRWIWMPYYLGTIIFLLLTFPSGRPVGRRGRAVAALSGVGMLLAAFGESFGTTTLAVFPGIDSPFALLPNTTARRVAAIGIAALAFGGAVAMVDLVRRWRAATGVERQQYRWLVLAGGLTVVAFGIGMFSYALTGDAEVSWFGSWLSELLLLVGLLAVPAAVAIAITRYGLYELDRILSRSLTYTTVVTLLAGVYVAGVLLLRGILPLQGDLAVALSTLAVVTIVQPVRHRVQRSVDRHFYRSRFDADRELERFAVRLRDHLDVDELVRDTTRTVATTLQPSTAGVWLRPIQERQP